MKFFNKNSVGIDISDRTMEIVEVQKSGNSAQVVNYNRLEIPAGIVEKGQILKAKELAELLENGLRSAKPKPITNRTVSVFLPESQVFIFTKSFSAAQKAKLNERIEEILEEQVPHDLDDLIFIHTIRGEEGGKIDVVIAAAPKSIVTQWRDFFASQKFDFENFDIEILADARAIIPALPAEPICLVDLGKRTTSVAIFDKKGLAYSYSMPQAGDTITQALVKELAIDFAEAEKQKIAIGIKGRKPADKRAAEIIGAEVASIIEDLQDTLTFFFQKTGIAVSKIYLLGGTSELPGLVEYVREHVKAQVEPAEAAPTIKLKGVSEASLYLGAIGTAMRNIGLDTLNFNLAITSLVKYKKVAKQSSGITTMPGEEEAVVEGSSASAEPEPVKEGNWIASHRKEAMLFGILITGIVLLIGALFYQSYSRARRAEELLTKTSGFNNQQTVQIKLPLLIGNQVSVANTARGTLLTKVWDPAISSIAPTSTQVAAEQSLSSSLSIWPEPIKVSDQSRELTVDEIQKLSVGELPEGLGYPLTYEWLVVSDQDVQLIGLSLLKNKFIGNAFIFNGLRYDSIEKSSVNNVFILTVTLDISFSKPAEVLEILQPDNFNDVAAPVSVPEVTPVPAIPAAPQVIIQNSPTGYVNVRSLPSTASQILGRALPGESYDFVAEQTGWVQINFKGQNGWVSATYAQKQ